MNRPFLTAYLAVYFALIIGAVATLQRVGVLRQIPFRALVFAIVLVTGIGVLAAITAGPPRGPRG